MTEPMLYLLAAVAWLGHLVLMIGTHNWCYGQDLPRPVSKIMHLVHALLVLAFLPLVLFLVDWQPGELLQWKTDTWNRCLLQAYLAVCVGTALVWLPFLTYFRRSRRESSTVQTELVDIAQQLGKLPIGNGHQAFLARLPGNEIFTVEYIQKSIQVPRLPAAWNGLTILHLTDLHFHGTPDRDYFRVILERCAAWNPDLVAITGDVADSPVHHRWIIPLLGRLRWRIAAFAILGNHDHRHDAPVIRRRLGRLGMRVLGNTWEQLEVLGERLVVIGHEGPWLPGRPDLTSCPPEPFRLCLSHTPDHIGWARRQSIDLMLAGHVHGGQIRLPLFGSVLVPSRYGRRYDSGTFEMPPTVMHVSRGLSGEHPVRYNCRPEVTLLRLESQAESLPPVR